MSVHEFPKQPKNNGTEPPDMELTERIAKIETIIPALASKTDIADMRTEMHKEFNAQTWRIIGAMITFGSLLVGITFFLARNIH